MEFFMPKHSSAAAARLSSDVDPATPIKPNNRQASSQRKHRRLESDFNWLECDEADEAQSTGSHAPTTTKSTSFSSDSDEDSDDYDSDDDEEVEGYSLPAGITPTELGSDGGSITSGSTSGSSSSGGGSHNSLLNDVMAGELNNDGGDLHTLNSLVNKLHAAELRRENKSNRHLFQQLKNERLSRKRPPRIDAGNGGHNHDQAEDDNGSAAPAPTPPSPLDLPSELPENAPPPHFSPLQCSSHRLSVSAVDSWRHGPSLEVVPTESVEDVIPMLNAQWDAERREWREEQQKKQQQSSDNDNDNDLDVKRNRTANDIGSRSKQRRGGGGGYGVRRNRSLPNVDRSPRDEPHDNRSGSNDNTPRKKDRRSSVAAGGRGGATISSATHRNYKYGKPPTQAKNPNPMVSKSSKKIHKKHARYALTAGMMLGIRESVGGAMGVEHEMEIRNWEEWEQRWREEGAEDVLSEDGDDGEEDDGDGGEEGEAHEVELDESRQDADDGSAANNVIIRSTSSQDLAKAKPLEKAASFARRSSGPSSPARSTASSSNSAAARTVSMTLPPATTLTAECERVSKYKFPADQFYLGSNTSKPLPHKYKFKVYAPLVFARIRSLFGVEKQTFLHSICGKFNFYEFASNARSGQFFFYSHDGRYMIKTLTHTESKFLREILPHYYRHLTRYPSTFLTHFYGMYRVCMPNYAGNNQSLHFVIMRSVFHTEKKIDRVWDLKGSKAGRKAGAGDGVGKDLDILEEGRKLRFKQPGTRAKFLDQLARDATFLARLGIMDYSLLLGLHEREGSNNDALASEENVPSPPNNDAPVTPRNSNIESKEEPERSNTPFRRGIIQRASSAGDTKVGNDGFKALEACNAGAPSKLKKKDRRKSLDDVLSGTNAPIEDALKAIPESPSGSESTATETTPPSPTCKTFGPPNSITSRADSGIEGYGARLEDGTLAKREIYFCGVIDILQYYNARKMGETVMRKAAGNSGQDISCVDPETYGKRFVKFMSNMVEE